MKILVVYQTKYGSTKEYAEWIAKDLKADLSALKDFETSRLSDYDLIIFGSFIHIGKITSASFLINNWEVLKTKKVILFTVSGAKPGSPDLEKFYEDSVPKYIRDQIKYFQFWGRVNNLDLKDTLLMQFPITLYKLKALTGDKQAKAAALGMQYPVDHVDKTLTKPLITYIQQNF